MLAALLAISLSPVVAAQPLDEQREEAEGEVEALQARLEDAVEKYNYACYKLEETKGRILTNEAELSEAQAELDENTARLNDRARAMYVGQQNTFLDVAVNSSSFDEFLLGLDLTKKVGRNDAMLVRDVKDAKARLEEVQRELEARKADEAAALAEVEASKNAVENELEGAQDKLAGIESEIQAALERRRAEAAAAAAASSSRRTTPSYDPVAKRDVPPGAPHGAAAEVAWNQLGKPYVWAAAGPDAFDCSGLTQYCYRVGCGIYITHSSYGQANCGVRLSVSELQAGDIVGFRGWGHVGIYVGGGDFIHAPHSGDVVRVASLSSRSNYCGAVRP